MSCDKHDELVKDISLIQTDIACVKVMLIEVKDSIERRRRDIEKHVDSGASWRIATISCLMGLLITIGSGIFYAGQITQKVNMLEKMFSFNKVVAGVKAFKAITSVVPRG